MIENIDSKYIQTFEYETSMISDGNILGTCELGTATIQMINDSNTYSSLKGQWIKTIHGSFYVYDVKPVQEKVNIELSCYDIKYKLDTPYDSSKHTFPCTLKAWRNSIFTECGVDYDDSDFPNSDLNLTEEPYVGDNPSNRQVISLIAQAGASAVITDKNDKFYFKWFKNTNNNITDWLELTTEKEATSPINVIVLGRGDVEDNVYYPETLPENKKELRIDNNYILDPQIAGETDRRYTVRKPIYNQINGFSFIPFSIRTQNVKNKLSIDLGDKVSYTDIWGNNLSSYVMTKKITYLGGDPSDDDNYEITLSAEEINETSTEYSYGSSIEQRLSKVEITTDKQNKKISALVEETNTKITDIEKSVPKYQTELDIYNITIPVDSELKPLENKDYLIGYKTKFEGAEVESTISSQSENTGITFGLSNNKIILSVLTSTAITNLSNEFVIDFSYTKDSTTYTDSKKIIVALALKGSSAEKPESTKTAEGTELVIADGKQVIEFRVDGKSTQETRSGKNLFNENNISFADPNNGHIEINDHVITMTALKTTSNNNLFVLAKIDDDLLVNGATYTISSDNVSGMAQSFKLQLRNKDGSYVSGMAAGFTITYDDNYSLYVRNNPFSLTNITIDAGMVAIVKNIQVEKGSTATSYEPYGVMPSPDYPSEIECVKGKNLLPNNAISQTLNGITFTVNSDKTITVNGTSTAVTDLYMVGSSTEYVDLGLTPGTHVLNGCPVGGSRSSYILYMVRNRNGNLSYYQEIGTGLTIDIQSGDTFRVFIRLLSGITVSNILYKPMLSKNGGNYVPYNNIQIKNIGKNWFNETRAKLVSNYIANTSIGTNWISQTIDLLPDTQYTITRYASNSASAPTFNLQLYLYEDTNNPLYYINNYTAEKNLTYKILTFKTGQSGKLYLASLYGNNDRLVSLFNNISIQIELGIVSTQLAPLKSQTLNIDLQGNELCSIDDVKDELAIKGGRAKIIKRIGKYVADNDLGANGISDILVDLITPELPIEANLTANELALKTMSNLMKGIRVQNTGLNGTTSTSRIRVSLSKKYASSYAEASAYLTTNHFTIYYPLSEEQEVDLGKIANIPMREEETNIYYVNDKLSPNIYCKYNTTYVGNNSYLHVKYSNDGTTFTSNDGNDVGRYIGSYSDNNETASTNFDDYSWQDTAIVVDEELDDLQGQINNTNKDLNNNYTNNTELDRKLEDQKQTITEEFSTRITMTKKEWEASVIEYINTNGVEKFVNTLVTIDIDGLKLSKSDEDIVSLLNNKGLYVSDGKLREDLTNLLMKVDRAGALFKLLEILGTIKEQGIIQKEKVTDAVFGECQAWYWIGE